MTLFTHLPIHHRIAGLALAGTLLILVVLGSARGTLRGEIVQSSPPGSASTIAVGEAVSSLRPQSASASEWHQRDDSAVHRVSVDLPSKGAAAGPYYVFLQKFPLEHSFQKIFHTEVIVCPRDTFDKDAAFLNMLDVKLNTLTPSRFAEFSVRDSAQQAGMSPFVSIDEEHWSKQSEPGCVQLGYGGANCNMGCCGSPHKHQNTNYALNSHDAVIGNAMGEYKELFLYGVSEGGGDVGSGGGGGISGGDAYKAVCHGHMNAIEMGSGLPKCVSDWRGQDYNPLTNNCNTFTSTVLKCVYGMSDAKPHLGVSDFRNVKCPAEKKVDGTEVDQCVIPRVKSSFEVQEVEEKEALSLE